jgi:ApaG protein
LFKVISYFVVLSEIVSHITEGVQVIVATKYMQDYSSPEHAHFVFGYKIKIVNNSPYTIQLIDRHWDIFDSCGEFREVDGEGVVGFQPVLEPGQSHEYQSGCNFKSNMGKMGGFYRFTRITDGTSLKVIIPEFVMAVPYILN